MGTSDLRSGGVGRGLRRRGWRRLRRRLLLRVGDDERGRGVGEQLRRGRLVVVALDGRDAADVCAGGRDQVDGGHGGLPSRSGRLLRCGGRRCGSAWSRRRRSPSPRG